MGWLFEKYDNVDNLLTILKIHTTNLPVPKIRIKLPKALKILIEIIHPREKWMYQKFKLETK